MWMEICYMRCTCVVLSSAAFGFNAPAYTRKNTRSPMCMSWTTCNTYVYICTYTYIHTELRVIARGIGREAIHAHSSPWARTHHDFIEVLVWAVAAGGPEDSPATLVNEGDSRRGQLLPCMHVHGPYGCVGGLMGGWISGGMGGCEWHVCMSTDDGS